MTRRKKDRPDQRNKNIVLVFFISLIVVFLTLLFSVASRASGQQLIPISVLALIAGVLVEGKRVSEKWSTVLGILLASLAFSMFAFLPGKREHDYNIYDHVAMWPYWFIIIFGMISVVTHGNKVVPRLTEGITLLQSIAVAYWVIDYGVFSTGSYFLNALMGIGMILSLYTLFHAFTYTPLTKNGRFTLSLWSTVIMMLFAIDNIYRVYQNEQIENTTDITHGAYVGLQYFLLGISAVYIIQNFMMLMGFLPGRGTFFNAEYFRDVRMLKAEHISRYSDRQVTIAYSMWCVIFTGAVFLANAYFQLLPRHMAIWIVFAVFPIFLGVVGYISGKYRYAYDE